MSPNLSGMSASRVLAVVGASGGVGASTLATAIAVRARAADVEAVLVDLCPLGGGLDVALGAEQERGIRWADLAGLRGNADGTALLARLPRSGELPVLSFDRGSVTRPSGDVVAEVLDALAAARALVVVDLPAGDPVAEVALDRADLVVVAVGSGLRQLAAASAVGAWLRGRGQEVVACLRGGRRAAELVPLLEVDLGLPVLCLLGDDRSVAADLVHGVPPGSRGHGSVSDAADACLARVVPSRWEGAA